MKALISYLGLIISITPMMANENFPKQEREAVSKEVSAMMKSFNKGDAKALIERTHPAIYKLANGRENFEAALIGAAKQIMDKGIVIESYDVGLPKQLYKAGKESVCFVPKITVMRMGDRRIKSTSYMVAVKGGDGKWRYLDGAGARRDPNQLWVLLPELPKDAELPENTIAVIEDEDVGDAGAGQPAIRPESSPDGGDNPKPQSQGRSR